ncbi:adenylate/guanylate cyclase domain-containing protein [Aestuariibacter salexigens]|uniref:adenylate/guanylate cyclase domain-containing protein n=1 Tax=Aestuariibacter salexigens TaxID=226010 RepID=UPI000424735F|nr:adenylate/guanylate cyclase domain-containing protein [Aestuariibacter salexigens]
MNNGSRKLQAVMFTDVVGYTQQTADDEKRMVDMISAINRLIAAIVKAYKGKFIKQIGDGTLSTFDSAFAAALCAVRVTQAVDDKFPVQIRVGIHLADIILKDNDVWGSGVNIASRIESKAEHGCIFVSEEVRHSLTAHPEFAFEEKGSFELKGVPEPVPLFKLTVPLSSLHKNDPEKLLFKERLIGFLKLGVAVVLVFAFIVYLWKSGSGDEPIDTLNIAIIGDVSLEQKQQLEKLFRYRFAPLLTVDIKTNSEKSEDAQLTLQLTQTGENSYDTDITFALNGSRSVLHQEIVPLMKLESVVATSYSALASHLLVAGSQQSRFLDKKTLDAAVFANEALVILQNEFNKDDLARAESLFAKIQKVVPQHKSLPVLKCYSAIIRFRNAFENRQANQQEMDERCNSLLEHQDQTTFSELMFSSYLRESGELDAARMYLERIDTALPDTAISHAKLLFESASQNKARQALNYLEEWQAISPIFSWEVTYSIAKYYHEVHEYEVAADLYAMLVQFYPDKPSLLTNQATVDFILGNFEQAVITYEKLNAIKPSAFSLTNQGTVYYYLGRFTEALRSYRDALKLTPNDYLLWGNYADTCREVPQQCADEDSGYRTALNIALQDSKSITPDRDPWLYLDVAHFTSQLGDFSKADGFFAAVEKELESDESLKPYYFYYRAINLLSQDKIQEAETELSRAVEYGYPRRLVVNTPDFIRQWQGMPFFQSLKKEHE